MEESEGTDRLSLDSRLSEPCVHLGAASEISSSPGRNAHLEVYVAELERELFRYKELYEREKGLRRQVDKEVQFLRIQLNRLSEKRVRFHGGPSTASDRDSQMREQFQTFSAMIDNKLQKFDSRQDTKEEDLKDKVHLIENFSVFGVPEDLLSEGEKEAVEGRVVTSMRTPSPVDQQAARMVFPSGALIRRIYGQRIFQKATEIITKSYSRENSFVIGFQSQSPGGLKSNPQTDAILNLLNPQRRLFCLCVGTYDFTYCGNLQPQLETSNTSMLLEERSVFDPRLTTSQIVPKNSSQYKPDEIAVSQRVYCISSYFPFFSFFEDLLLMLLNTLKVERLEIYSQRVEGLVQADSRYHAMRVKQLFEQKVRRINARAIIPNMVYQVRLTNDAITLKTHMDKLQYSYLEECLFQILSVFTLETFVEVLTLCLLEQKVVFVCDNSHILTYTVYLFVNLLVRPLVYAFASVYILPSEEFLSVPFPVIYGLLKKKKWFEQNRIFEQFKNTYVFLNPVGVHVEYTENRKDILKARPDKLRTMLSPFFKEIEKSRKMWAARSSSYHIELNEYVQVSSPEERRNCICILQTVKRFIKEEVLDHVPCKQRIAQIKKDALRFPIPKLKDEHTHVIGYLVKAVKDQRKHCDSFFERVLNTQMMSMYFSALV